MNGRVIAVAGAPSTTAAHPRVETVPPGDVFLLGDNAAVSIDSRSFGPVPDTEVVAQELLVIGKPPWIPAIAASAVILAGLALYGARVVRVRG